MKTQEQIDKDNRLIAAAPELLEACKLAYKYINPGNIRKDFDRHIAKAALGKAIYNAEGTGSITIHEGNHHGAGDNRFGKVPGGIFE